MTVVLASDVEDFLQKQVRSGVCVNADELINDIIRSLRQQQEKPLDVTPELENWLLEAADKPTTPLTRKDFNAMRYKRLFPEGDFKKGVGTTRPRS